MKEESPENDANFQNLNLRPKEQVDEVTVRILGN